MFARQYRPGHVDYTYDLNTAFATIAVAAVPRLAKDTILRDRPKVTADHGRFLYGRHLLGRWLTY